MINLDLIPEHPSALEALLDPTHRGTVCARDLINATPEGIDALLASARSPSVREVDDALGEPHYKLLIYRRGEDVPCEVYECCCSLDAMIGLSGLWFDDLAQGDDGSEYGFVVTCEGTAVARVRDMSDYADCEVMVGPEWLAELARQRNW